MEKFWNKSSASADIFIYGDIVADKWTDADTTAKSFIDDLNSFDGKPVTIHINSGGGDVFQALAIANVLKNYSGGVTVSIDGLCASAATIIACGSGGKIRAASNSLFMLHLPSVALCGFYDTPSLEKIQNSLSAVENSIIETYESRFKRADAPKNARDDLRTMIQSETWLSASKAQSYGFIDEITDEVDLKIDDAKKLLVVNNLNVDIKKFDEEKLRRAMEVKNMEVQNEQSFFEKLTASIKDALTTKEVAENPTNAVDATQIRQQELSRVRDLQALKCENAAVNAIVDAALIDGKTVAEIQPYVDAVKKIPAVAPVDNAAEKIVAVIREQMQSGAEGVQGGQETVDPVKNQQDLIVKFANGGK
ncbi:MAG: Clp protease ClpP [Selenomonadaceae bacterium]|nr:Clp protease ClpP [Selenomonadaceae bacterium]MBR1805826.1 Clp protease ClpP [Selenomonadaceae bacterium]